MPKISTYDNDTSLATTDYVLGNKASGPSTQKFRFSDLIAFFWTLSNVPLGGTSPITRDSEIEFDFIASNTGVITADSVGVNRNASITAVICYISGIRVSAAASTARTYTASKDTYIDVLSNNDGTGTFVFTEVSNNAASPALSANSIRLGIVVTGATTIAATTSINQGQETRVLPIASSIAYSVTDSLGNLICPRDPNRKILGYRQVIAPLSGITSATIADLTGLSMPVIVPTGRKIKVSILGGQAINSTSSILRLLLRESATVLQERMFFGSGTSVTNSGFFFEHILTPTAGSHTYVASASNVVATGTITPQADPTYPMYIKAEIG